ncbi:MFS transporter [Sphingomonas sp. BT-65]|uniref:MFS transporter n=1 Tax=Sphingomonas sp. BT-65 TaxID=2989821 RepID=UPI002235EC39|nr:MFS transporter [Sphingomonas sp. BT-65]MCW4460919.1 MFS transporter [Sphingomonas sp. BT-65]
MASNAASIVFADQASVYRRGERAKLVAGVTIGNALEFFDITVYSFVAVTIGKVFFPNLGAYEQLLLSVATFGVGFVTRPLGGLVLGAYADRAGRKAAMTLTLALMALGSAMIGLAPTYEQIGILAPLLVVFARLLQGFSAGGEVGASTALLVELSGPRTRSFYTSWQLASQGLGVAFGALVATATSSLLDPAAFISWGWRVPFLIGTLILPIGLYIRRTLKEPATPAVNSGDAAAHPFRSLFTSHKRDLALAVMLTIGGTVSAYMITFYLPTYGIAELKLPMASALQAGILGGVMTFLVAPLGGIAADRLSPKKIAITVRSILALLMVPAFLLINAVPTPLMLMVTVGVLASLQALGSGATMAIIPSLLPRHLRASGLGTVYAIGVAIFGGFAQFAATWLVHNTGSKISPAWYVIACIVISLIALWAIEDRTSGEID